MATLTEQHLEAMLPDLLAFVRSRIGPVLRSKETSRDLVQSVCREVLERQDRFVPRDASSLRHWLFETATRKIRDRGRFVSAGKRAVRRERPLSMDEGVAGSAGRSPSSEAVFQEDVARVERAMLDLPEDYRAVILLAKVQGLSHREIAVRLDRTEHACHMLLSRALARLAALLDDADAT